ncbi:MAG TPA: DUF4199 domain-containing protein [Chitinophagales bacterium]|nr:DUF4199 domain-containing protein [Chitinophagales bacterium]
METQKSAFSTALKYAIITALAMFIFSIILYITGMYLNNGMNWLSYIIMLAGLVFAVKDRRDKDLGGFLSFGEGFKAGFLFCIITGAIGMVFSLIMMNFIAPDMMDEILKKAEADMINKGLPDSQIQVAMEWTRKFTSPLWIAIWSLVSSAFFGAILSLIVAAIFKKDNQQLQQPQ